MDAKLKWVLNFFDLWEFDLNLKLYLDLDLEPGLVLHVYLYWDLHWDLHFVPPWAVQAGVLAPQIDLLNFWIHPRYSVAVIHLWQAELSLSRRF